MSFRVKDKSVGAVIVEIPDITLEEMSVPYHHPKTSKDERAYRCVNQIAILHHLSKEEALLLVIERSTSGRINIRDRREAISDSTSGVDRYESVPCPVAVHLVSYITISLPEP